MDKRIGWSGAALSFFTGAILAVFQVMEWKMPDWLALIIIGVSLVAALVALGILFHGIWVWSGPMRSLYGLRTPIYRRKANPYQELIDIAREQRANPTSHLVVIDRIVIGTCLNEQLPYVRVRVRFANFSLNEVSITQPEGYAYFGNNRLPTKLEDTGATYTVPPGNTATSFDLDIYVPSELLQGVSQEVDSPSGEIRSLSLSQVSAKVQAKGEDAPSVIWHFSTGREVFRPNR